MPFLALLANPLLRKLLLGALVLFAISAAAFAAIKHYEAKGARDAKAEQEAADTAWMKGAVENMNKVQAYYAPYVEALTKAENDRAAQLQEISRLSAANDSLPGLDAAGVERLRKLAPQRQDRLGSAGKPAGAAAR